MRCPVGSDLQLIRRQWIDSVEFYDERLHGSDAVLDYLLRVSQAGGECILHPSVRADAVADVDVEPKSDTAGAAILRAKLADVDFKPWVPEHGCVRNQSRDRFRDRPAKLEDLFHYEVVVIQQPRGVSAG